MPLVRCRALSFRPHIHILAFSSASPPYSTVFACLVRYSLFFTLLFVFVSLAFSLPIGKQFDDGIFLLFRGIPLGKETVNIFSFSCAWGSKGSPCLSGLWVLIVSACSSDADASSRICIPAKGRILMTVMTMVTKQGIYPLCRHFCHRCHPGTSRSTARALFAWCGSRYRLAEALHNRNAREVSSPHWG